jgi:predicted ATPase
MHFIRRYQVIGLHYYQNYDFKFDHPINILVGESGLGKTKILHLLYLTLTCSWITLAKQEFDFISIWLNDGKQISFSKGELEFYLLTTYENIDFGRKKSEIKRKFVRFFRIISSVCERSIVYFPVYRDIMDDFGVIGKNYSETRFPKEFAPEEIIEAQRIERDILIPLSINHLINNKINQKKLAELQELVELCNSYLFGVRVIIGNYQTLSIINKSTDEVVELTQLSSGEKQLIYFFLKVHFSDSDHTYVLFDEPELSIPIDWQRRLLIDLSNLKKNVSILAITHSPFIFDNNLDLFATGINVFKI